jgi:hypothetical protein
MNSYIKAGKCPFCQGSGWHNGLPCEDCVGTGTIDGLWDHHRETLNLPRSPAAAGPGSPEEGDQ